MDKIKGQRRYGSQAYCRIVQIRVGENESPLKGVTGLTRSDAIVLQLE